MRAQNVASYIVWKFQKSGNPISNLKLQKLLYYVQGWSLAINGAAAFDDKIEAWLHGPVVESVYNQYKEFQHDPIVFDGEPDQLGPKLSKLVDSVTEEYGNKEAHLLEQRVFRESPWKTARKGLHQTEESTNEIAVKLMKRFFDHHELNRFFSSLVGDVPVR